MQSHRGTVADMKLKTLAGLNSLRELRKALHDSGILPPPVDINIWRWKRAQKENWDEIHKALAVYSELYREPGDEGSR